VSEVLGQKPTRKKKKFARIWRKWAATCINSMFKRTGVRPNITIDELCSLASYACPCCDTPMILGNKKQKDSPSVDRLNNDVGYVLSNIWIICHSCNSIKRDLTDPNKLHKIANAWWNRITICK